MTKRGNPTFLELNLHIYNPDTSCMMRTEIWSEICAGNCSQYYVDTPSRLFWWCARSFLMHVLASTRQRDIGARRWG